MNQSTPNMALRLWMLFILLAYSVQSVGAVGWSNESSQLQSHTISECHEMNSQMASVGSMTSVMHVNSTEQTAECCTLDCPMVSCHNVSIFVSNSTELRLAKSIVFDFSFKPLKPFNISSNPYRPPILA